MLRRTLLSGSAWAAMVVAAEALPRGKVTPTSTVTPIPLTLMAQGSNATAPFHTSWPGFKKGDFFPTTTPAPWAESVLTSGVDAAHGMSLNLRRLHPCDV